MKRIKIISGYLCICAALVCNNLIFHSTANGQVPVFNAAVLDTSSTGYYFLTSIKFGPNPGGIKPCFMILDENGFVVYYRQFLPLQAPGNFCLQPNGLMSYNMSGKHYLMDSTFKVVDSVATVNGIQMDGHELQILPNGHYLVLGFEYEIMDLSSVYLFNHNGSPGSAAANVKCGVVQELDANKNLLFEWHCKDHLSVDDADENFLNSPNTVDWTHCNAIDMDDDGNILLSSRHLNEITKINRSDSTVMWRMGGKKNQFTFLNDTQQFKGQHDIRRISNGNVTLFDNGDGNASNPFHEATAKEYTLDETLLTANLAWSYTENNNSYSRAMGNVQRLDNGNTLTNYGAPTNSNILFNVVKSNGQKVFELTTPDSLVSYRSFNYPTLPWNIPRPVISCYSQSGQHILDAGPGYAAYHWSNGATTQAITLTSTDTFYVFVALNNGGFISSERFVVSNLSNPCGLSAIAEYDWPSLSMAPQPLTNMATVTFSLPQSGLGTLKMFNMTGQLVQTCFSGFFLQGKNEVVISKNQLTPGIYRLQLESGSSGNGMTFVVE